MATLSTGPHDQKAFGTSQDSPLGTSTTGASRYNESNTAATRKRTAGVPQPDSYAAQANSALNTASVQASAALNVAGEHASVALNQAGDVAIKTKSQIQQFLEQHDLTPQNQLVWHACFTSLISVGLLILPSLVLKYNIPVAMLRGTFGIAGKESGHKLYALIFGALGASSFALSGPLWPQAKNSLEQIAVARLAIAAFALFLTFFLRLGSDALLLLGIGELAAGIVLIKTEQLEMDNLVTVAKEGATVAQGHAQVLAGAVQDQAAIAQAKLQQTELGAKIQAHPIGQKVLGTAPNTANTTNAPQPL